MDKWGKNSKEKIEIGMFHTCLGRGYSTTPIKLGKCVDSSISRVASVLVLICGGFWFDEKALYHTAVDSRNGFQILGCCGIATLTRKAALFLSNERRIITHMSWHARCNKSWRSFSCIDPCGIDLFSYILVVQSRSLHIIIRISAALKQFVGELRISCGVLKPNYNYLSVCFRRAFCSSKLEQIDLSV